MTNPTNGSVAGAVEYDAAAVTAADKKVYSHRAKLICGLEGGMPLNMTLPAMCKVRGHLLASVPSDTASIAAVTLGMGDALVPALFANCPRVGWVAGLELIDYVSGEPQACAEKMLRGSTAGRSLQWGVDVLAVTQLPVPVAAARSTAILAYSFDESIVPKARAHWYALLEADRRVVAVATTWHRGLDMGSLLPSFKLQTKLRAPMEGGNCSRTMLILYRASNAQRLSI